MPTEYKLNSNSNDGLNNQPNADVKIRQMQPYFRGKKKKETSLNLGRVDTIVLHWTGGSSLKGAVDHLFTVGNSYHFIIDNDEEGTVNQTKPIKERANHAGCSYGPQGAYVGNYSIGISFVTVGGFNADNLVSDAQLNSAIRLMSDLNSALKDNGGNGLNWFTTHYQISPNRKEDPYSLEPKMNEIETRLRTAIGNDNITYWQAGMSSSQYASSWPKGLHKSTECIDTAEQADNNKFNHKALGTIEWCKTAKGTAHIQGGTKHGCSDLNVYTLEEVVKDIQPKLKDRGDNFTVDTGDFGPETANG